MNYSDYRFSLDINESVSAVCPRVKKGDTVRRLIITLTQNGRPYLPGDGCSAVFKGEKPDGTVIFNECTVNNGSLTVPITSQTIAVPGKVKCEISLYSETGDLLTSPTFDIAVDDTVSDDDAIESANEYTALAKMIGEVGSIDLAVKDALERAMDEENFVSPTVSVTQTADGHTVTVTDMTGEQQFEVENGKNGRDGVSLEHSWSGTVLTVTSASGTDSADLKGEKGDKGDKGDPGENGKDGKIGTDGKDGKDGVSLEHSWSGTVLTVTSASGTDSADLKGEKGDKGDKGDPGEDGQDGASAYDIAKEAGFAGTEKEFAEKLAYPDVGIHIGTSAPDDDNAVLWVDTDETAVGGESSGSNVSTPDWLQNDETASDYIKNRPFSESIFELLSETEVTFEDGIYEQPEYTGELLVSDETYTVTWNGTEYTCVAQTMSGMGGAIGNVGLAMGGTDTGEPFVIVTMASEGMLVIMALDGSTSATVKITGNIIKKIEEKFLPALPVVAYIPIYVEAGPVYSTTVTVGELSKMINDGKMVIAKIYNTNVDPINIHYYPLWYHDLIESTSAGHPIDLVSTAWFSPGNDDRYMRLSWSDPDFTNLPNEVYAVLGKM